jgi:hypothetical protein
MMDFIISVVHSVEIPEKVKQKPEVTFIRNELIYSFVVIIVARVILFPIS